MNRISIGAAAMAVSLFGTIHATPAAIIVPTVTQASSENPYGLDRAAVRTRDGSGLAVGISGIPGASDSTHGNVANGNMWTTRGNTGSPVDKNPFITFDLGEATNLQVIRIWSYNENLFTRFGARHIRVSTSANDVEYTDLGDIEVAQGGGATADPAQDFSAFTTAIAASFESALAPCFTSS